MYVITVDFIANTEDPEAVKAAYKPIMDAYMEHDACLGCQIVQKRSRKEATHFRFVNLWRSREEAIEISSRPEVSKAHDLIEAVQTGKQQLQAWVGVNGLGVLKD